MHHPQVRSQFGALVAALLCPRYLIFVIAHFLFVQRFHEAPFRLDNIGNALGAFIPGAIFFFYSIVMAVVFLKKLRNQGLTALFSGENAIFNTVELSTIVSSIVCCALLLYHNNNPDEYSYSSATYMDPDGGTTEVIGMVANVDNKSYSPQIWGSISALMIWSQLFMKMRSFASIGLLEARSRRRPRTSPPHMRRPPTHGCFGWACVFCLVSVRLVSVCVFHSFLRFVR